MSQLLELFSPFTWSYVDNFGKEVHGNGRCLSRLDALTKLCKNAGVPLTDEVKEQFGVNEMDAETLKTLQADVQLLKYSNIKTLDMIAETNKIVQEATKPAPPKKKAGRPKKVSK